MSVFGEHCAEMIGLIDEKQHVVELIVYPIENPSRGPFRRGRKQANVEGFVRLRINAPYNQ